MLSWPSVTFGSSPQNQYVGKVEVKEGNVFTFSGTSWGPGGTAPPESASPDP